MLRLPIVLWSLTFVGCTSISALRPPESFDSQSIASEATREPLTGRPSLGQADIDRALSHFRIAVPAGVPAPIYDADLMDRGQTNWQPFAGVTSVKIGPAAFASWALLGSTLSHEVEVHCRQNLLYIATGDTFGLPTKLAAEREAYRFEIDGAERFGLDAEELELIAATLAQLSE